MVEDGIDLETMFPPQVLRQYALLADGERGAIVGPRGDIAWLCAPRWDSDAVFGTMVGAGGSYTVTPDDARYVWGGFYEPGSLIWRNRWIGNDHSTIECRDALRFPGERGRVVLLRRIHAVQGPARVQVYLQPRAGFGRYANTRLTCHDGVWTGHSGPLRWRWTGAAAAGVKSGAGNSGKVLAAELTIAEGEQHDLVLEISDAVLPGDLPDAEQCWQITSAAWARSRPNLATTLAPRDATHAWVVLRGLTSADGGMVAAATMSLPERANAGRNFDYRYAWIRDQSYAGLAAAAAGADDVLDAATRFVSARLLVDGPRMRPAYTVDGAPVPAERTLDLPGYPGGTDKVGNWVNEQFQLDAYGEALQLLAAAARADRLDAESRQAIQVAADAIENRWQEPESGIWEIDDRTWTQSRLACVAGLRAVAALPGARTDITRHTALADRILADTATSSMHRDGYWQRSPELTGVDASLLLPLVRGALAEDDPRIKATVDAVRTQLATDGYVYRYRHDDRDLGESEGAFLLCGFMLALAEHQQGDPVAARHFFERNRAACGPAGLFSEEYDVIQRQLRGNLPQAFVHALLLETAVTMSDSGEGKRR